MEAPALARPTEVSKFGRPPTEAEYHREIGAQFAATVYDIERFCRLVFPMGQPATPLARFKTFYPWQAEFFGSINAERRRKAYVPDGPKVVPILRTLSSGKGAGKTHILAMLIWHLMATMPWAQGIATATTELQLNDRLWAHVRSLWELSPILQAMFNINSEHAWHREYQHDWKCTAMVPTKHNPDALRGVHGIYNSFAVGDECSGIPGPNFEALDGMWGDPQVVQCYASNPGPTRTGVWFARTFGPDRHEWSPQIIDVSQLPDANHAVYDRMRAKHGENSSYYLRNVRGLPPKAESGQLIEPETIERQAAAPLDTEAGTPRVTEADALVVGVDLSGGGNDNFVAHFRRGIDARSIPPIVIPGRIRSFGQVVDRCRQILEGEYDGRSVDMMFLDRGMHGGPAYDSLCDFGYRGSVVPVWFKGVPPDPDYANMRAYMYGQVAEWMERGGCIPHLELLMEELAAQRLDPNARLIQIIDKDLIKLAIGRSCDNSDALALTFAEKVRPVHLRGARGRRRKKRRTNRSPAMRFAASPDGWQS